MKHHVLPHFSPRFLVRVWTISLAAWLLLGVFPARAAGWLIISAKTMQEMMDTNTASLHEAIGGLKARESDYLKKSDLPSELSGITNQTGQIESEIATLRTNITFLNSLTNQMPEWNKEYSKLTNKFNFFNDEIMALKSQVDQLQTNEPTRTRQVVLSPPSQFVITNAGQFASIHDFTNLTFAFTNLVKALTDTNERSNTHGQLKPDILATSLNIMWTLLAGFLVMFMQAGFALVETGFVRKKNAAHTMAMNFMVYGLAMLGYWVCGFAFQMGGVGFGHSDAHSLGSAIFAKLNVEWGQSFGGLLGGKGFFLSSDTFAGSTGVLEGGIFALFLFQMVFMDTAATIPTGAMAERWRFLPFCLYAFAVGAFIYPVYSNWVWGGGWLSALGKNMNWGNGTVDFAGSSVVHLTGGTLAFVGAKMLGARYDRYDRDRKSKTMPKHNLSFGVLGTFILAFGWFGFNAGSTLAGTDTQIGVIATNTMLASAAGAFSAMALTWLLNKKPNILYMCNGMLGGLVAITAPCAFVDSWAAVVIGLVAGIWVLIASTLIEETWKLVDDPVGAISVHGACGIWGMIALGIFANGRYGYGLNGVAQPVTGLVAHGGFSQLKAQCAGVGACIITVSILAFILFWLLNQLPRTGNRPSQLAEEEGLDKAELGVDDAYDPEPDAYDPKPEPD